MIIQYVKQALGAIRENPLVSFLTALGTALSVAMLLVLVMMYEVNTASYAPVSERNRMMYITIIEGKMINEPAIWHGGVGERIVRECFYPMQTPEAITAFGGNAEKVRTTAPGNKLVRESDMLITDAAYWKVYNFRFLAGSGYTQEAFESAIPEAVISEVIAREFFGTTDVVGQTIELDFVSYTIRGVVEPVSKAVKEAYSEVWIPYSLNKDVMLSSGAEGICNRMRLTFLAKDKKDFAAIKEEATKRVDVYNKSLKEWKANIWKQPVTSIQQMFYNISQDRMHGTFSGFLMLAALFLLLPVFNLLGLIFSQIQKRRPEIGLRKAFGAQSKTIVGQILAENLVITFLGSLLGLGLSVLFFYIAKDSLLMQEGVAIRLGMILQPTLFMGTFLLSLVINLLSAGIPAWRAANDQVADSLHALVK